MVLVAGCFGDEPVAPAPDEPAPPIVDSPQVVVAVVDSGINAYHHGFRDLSPLAIVHPSHYIDGYPAGAIALNLTLDAADWETGLLADCELWNNLEPKTLYWIPRTRIIGLWLDLGWEDETVDCAAGERPHKGVDVLAPHGSMAAGRAAGETTSLCPTCRIVATQMGQNTFAMDWASQQPWIDVQTNSWVGYEHNMVPGDDARGPRELAVAAAERQVAFAGSGNGVREYADTPEGTYGGSFGIGIPSHLRPTGVPGILVVGGHDNGQVILWPGTMPHVVADAEEHPSTDWNKLDGGVFNGTSGSTPFVAGSFAGMIFHARMMVGDLGAGLRDGNLVVAPAGGGLPAKGPLSDGLLSRAEAEAILLHTATPRPVEELPYDGEIDCPPVDCVKLDRGNALGPWAIVPEGIPAYYYLGYGQVGVASQALAMQVLRGESELPERPTEDQVFGYDAEIRQAVPS